jgi:hypothetical protein
VVLWDVGLVGVSNIMLARKLSSMLPPPGVPLRRRLTGTDPGIARTPGRERKGCILCERVFWAEGGCTMYIYMYMYVIDIAW